MFRVKVELLNGSCWVCKPVRSVLNGSCCNEIVMFLRWCQYLLQGSFYWAWVFIVHEFNVECLTGFREPTRKIKAFLIHYECCTPSTTTQLTCQRTSTVSQAKSVHRAGCSARGTGQTRRPCSVPHHASVPCWPTTARF